MQQNFTTGKFLLIGIMLIATYYTMSFFSATTNPNIHTQQGIDAEAQPAHAATEPDGPITIQHIDAEALNNAIISADKPTLLFVYASWCPYCQQQFPVISEIKEQYSDRVNIIGLSTDRSDEALANFLAQKPQPLAFSPYRVKTEHGAGFQDWLRGKGGNFRGVPYSILFSTDGSIMEIYSGLNPKAQFAKRLDKITPITN